MKIQTVSYQKVFPIAMYVNERIGLEATIDDSESPEAALLILKKIVTEFHEKNNPHLYNDSIQTPEPTTLPVKQVEKELSSVEAQINEITDIKVLESFKLLVKNNKAWQECYDKKMEELTK